VLRRADFLKAMGNINARPSNGKLTLLTLEGGVGGSYTYPLLALGECTSAPALTEAIVALIAGETIAPVTKDKSKSPWYNIGFVNVLHP
jgi:hypothetical protein